jgi:torulene dioxygenase
LRNQEELREPQSCVITGSFPNWLSGSLYRAGPGVFDVTPDDPSKPPLHLHHWFDALSLQHKFVIHPNNGGVVYSSRSGSDTYKRILEQKGHVDRISFGQLSDPCESLFRKVASFFYAGVQKAISPAVKQDPTDTNVCVNIVQGFPAAKPGNLVVLSDNAVIQEVDENLNPLRTFAYDALNKALSGLLCCIFIFTVYRHDSHSAS